MASAPSSASGTSSKGGDSAGDTPTGGDSTAPSGGPFCTALKDFNDQLTTLEDADFKGDMGKLKADMGQLKQTAPPAIAPDVQELTTVVGQVVGGDTQAEQTLQDPAFVTATDHVATYEGDNCPGAL